MSTPTESKDSRLSSALLRLTEAQAILAENPEWAPAQERVRAAELILDRENADALNRLKAKLDQPGDICAECGQPRCGHLSDARCPGWRITRFTPRRSEQPHTNGPLRVEVDPTEPRNHCIWTDEEGVDQMSILVASTAYAPASAPNARLLAAAYTSYDRHFGPDAVAAAEEDVMGSLIGALKSIIADIDAGRMLTANRTAKARAVLSRVRKEGR